jgi:hypothetical protein
MLPTKFTLLLSCFALLSACQGIQERASQAETFIENSSLQFRRLMASLDMQRYVPGIPDMPVYQGFKPQGDENTVYDVIEGRIIDITYASNIADEQKVRDFYEIALMQLGWKATHIPNQFTRDGETLVLEITRSGQTVILRISLRPADK